MAETVLILGAHSDMGLAIARSFAKRKHPVILAGRREEGLREMSEDLRIRFGVETSTALFDIRKFDSHQGFWNSLPVKPGVVVMVAGFMAENEKAVNDWSIGSQTIETNYSGPVSLLNVVAKDMRERRRGTIVGISSVAGERGRQSNYMYGSAKAGFTAYLSGLRNDLYHYGVHVVSVLPGFVYTKMTAHLTLPPMLTAKPEEVGEAIYKAVAKRRDIVYVRWFWLYIMLVIRSIPEFIFKKKKL